MSNMKTREEIIEIIYMAIKESYDCVIEIANSYTKESVYFVASTIDGTHVLLSLCAGDRSFGNKFLISVDTSDIHNWISEISSKLFAEENIVDININDKSYIESEIPDIPGFNYFETDTEDEEDEIEVPDGYYDIIDYRADYLTKHNQMKLFQEPIEISTRREANTYFGEFLDNDKCDKMIFALSVPIPDLKTVFRIDIVVDKLYVYGRSFTSFILVRPDMCNIDFKDPSDTLLEFDDRSIRSKDEIITHFSKVISSCFYRCTKVSKENIKIEVYSNYRIQ